MNIIFKLRLVAVLSVASLLVSLAFAVSVSSVIAQSEVTTALTLRAEAPSQDYDYPPVHIFSQIEPLPPIYYLDTFKDVKLSTIDPDGKVSERTVYFDRNGILNDYIHMEKNGTWVIRISFPGQDFSTTDHKGTVHYLPSENQTSFTRNASSWADKGSWTSKASMHQARSNLGAAVVDGKIYAIGGLAKDDSRTDSNMFDHRTVVVNTTEEYDPTANKWTIKTPMPTQRYNLAAVAYGDKVYCLGGLTGASKENSSLTLVNEVYEPATDTWTNRAPMPVASSGQAYVLGNKIYFVGNSLNGTVNMAYDPENDSWSVKTPPKPQPNQVSASVGNKIYVIGYWEDLDNNVAASTLIYDPRTDSWSNGQAVSSSFFSNRGIYWRGDWWSTGAGSISGIIAPMRIYVFFMQYVYSGPIPNVQYDPAANSWSTVANEPKNRQDFAVATLNDTLYLIGGFTSYYPAPDDSLFAIIECADTEQYIPVGYGIPDPSYQPPEAIISPEFQIQSPINQTYNSSSVPLVFSANKALNWSRYSLDGKENMTLSSNTTLTDLSVGAHNITLYAIDTYGNIGASETIAFTVAQNEAAFPLIEVAEASIAFAIIACVGLFVYYKRVRSAPK